jgi:hypothetical protein
MEADGIPKQRALGSPTKMLLLSCLNMMQINVGVICATKLCFYIILKIIAFIKNGYMVFRCLHSYR